VIGASGDRDIGGPEFQFIPSTWDLAGPSLLVLKNSELIQVLSFPGLFQELSFQCEYRR
jgi:hypothetical protein